MLQIRYDCNKIKKDYLWGDLMQNRWIRLFAILLVLCFSLSMFAFAVASAEESGVRNSELSDEELIRKYSIPNSWARPALLFAVRNEILFGTDDGTLSPKKTATRAELAAIFSRILPTEHRADLSQFTDMKSSKWYYDPMAQAAAMGLVSGTGNTTMSPKENATREQAFVMIARAFALPEIPDINYYKGYKDWQQVGKWAVPYVNSLLKSGIVNGSDGYLNPKQNITRQEFAQLLYNIITRFSPSVSGTLDGMTVSTASSIPAGTVINGDLLICNDAPEMTLNQVTVTGRLILQGVDSLKLTVSDCNINELILCRVTDAELDKSVNKTTVNIGQSTISGDVRDLIVNADTILCCGANSVIVNKGNFQATSENTILDLFVEYTAAGSILQLNGTVRRADFEVPVSVSGDGMIQRMNVFCESFDVNIPVETLTVTPDPGLSGLILHCTAQKTPTIDDPRQRVDLTFSGEMPRDGYCDIAWYVNGVYQRLDSAVRVATYKSLHPAFDFSCDFWKAPDQKVKIVITYRGQSRAYEFNIPVQSAYISDVSEVHSVDILANVIKQTSLYSNKNLTGYVCTVPEGTEVVYMEYDDPSNTKVRLPDGRTGWVDRKTLDIQVKKDYYTLRDYTTEVKGKWINSKSYSSSTGYLIWCNLYTQHINIFYASGGKWKLALSTECATGIRESPTPQEVTTILYKVQRWDYPSFYVHHVSVFDNDRGFHSVPYNYDGTVCANSCIGSPASHGCIRLPEESVMYIWNYVPVGTTVVIY